MAAQLAVEPGVGVWLPTSHTLALGGGEPALSDGPRLIALVERFYRMPDGSRLVLDDWQKWLITHVLERYPLDWPVERLRGRLRYRQVVISMGRQNGKSILGAVFALYGLLQHVAGASVVGIATSVEQANVIYDRVAYAVRNEPKLTAKLKATGTRGIRHRDGSGTYLVKPALEEGLQSVPITLCTADELHLAKAAMWDSVVNGQRAQKDGLIVGITTAGDDSSLLLKRLYAQGVEAIGGGHERFGFFLWEAPEGATIDTPGAIEAANPAIACGRIDVETVRSDVRALPEVDQQRYTLNRFVASVNSWLPMAAWAACGTGGVPEGAADVVFSLDRSPSWEFATVVATSKAGALRHTEVVASIPKPDLDLLVQVCIGLAGKVAAPTFAMDGFMLSGVGKELKTRGLDVWMLTPSEMNQASAGAYAAVIQRRISHNNDELLARQNPRARRKNTGDAWRLSRTDSGSEIDAVLATVIGLHVAEIKPDHVIQLF